MHISYYEGFDPIEAIIPSPFGKKWKSKSRRIAAHSRKLAELEVGSACFSSWWYSGDLQFTEVYCKEHRRGELVPNGNGDDLVWWYKAGLHPRFSIRRALLETGQQIVESSMRGFLNLRNSAIGDKVIFKTNGDIGMSFREVLRRSRTPRQFLKLVRPLLFTNLYSRGRRYRVRNSFKEKAVARSFIVEDFFQERNHELRRLMIRRGLSIQNVLSRMELVAKDEEGALYVTKEWSSLRYLYVKCPSTGQEYLLSVPTDTVVNGHNVAINSPKEARRWTFNLPNDSDFAQEA